MRSHFLRTTYLVIRLFADIACPESRSRKEPKPPSPPQVLGVFFKEVCLVCLSILNVIGTTCIGGLPISTVISVILIHQRLPIVSGEVLTQEVVHEAIAATYSLQE